MVFGSASEMRDLGGRKGSLHQSDVTRSAMLLGVVDCLVHSAAFVVEFDCSGCHSLSLLCYSDSHTSFELSAKFRFFISPFA